MDAPRPPPEGPVTRQQLHEMLLRMLTQQQRQNHAISLLAGAIKSLDETIGDNPHRALRRFTSYVDSLPKELP